MAINVAKEVATLRHMTVSELRDQTHRLETTSQRRRRHL
jgi:hypothetical protein